MVNFIAGAAVFLTGALFGAALTQVSQKNLEGGQPAKKKA